MSVHIAELTYTFVVSLHHARNGNRNVLEESGRRPRPDICKYATKRSVLLGMSRPLFGIMY